MSDLKRHLRRQASKQDMLTCEYMFKAADRIDELEDRCGALQQSVNSLNAIIDQMWEDQKPCEALVEKERDLTEELEAERDALQARLDELEHQAND